MKRHPSLIPLSRFHRSVLFLALVCKKNAPPVKGYPEDDKGKKDYALSFYQGPLRRHINQEEQQLFPAVASKSAELQALVAELKDEHQQLDQLFSALTTATDLPGALDDLGILLEKHVRKEERQFFQLIQQTLSETEMEDLKSKLGTDATTNPE